MLSTGHTQNFNTLVRAAREGFLALVEMTEISTGKVRAVVCAVNTHPDGSYSFAPFGHLSDGDPYEEYEPPFMDEEGAA